MEIKIVYTVESSSEADVGGELSDEELLLFPVVESDDGLHILMAHAAQPSHVLIEVLFGDFVHVLESLHHHHLPIQPRLVTRPEHAAA